jgi:ABC-2 type transport system permease protein
MTTLVPILRAESTKLRSLRSVWYTTLIAAVLGIGFGALASSAQANAYFDLSAADQAIFDPTSVSLSSTLASGMVIAILGTLVITSEYATGMIRTTLAAVPRRGRLFDAKVLNVAAVGFALSEFVAFTCFFVGQALLAGTGAPHASLDQPGVLRAVVGAGLYLAALALLGLGIGTLVRSTAGAISLLMTITLLVRLVSMALPEAMARWMNKYWPTTAGGKIINTVPDPESLPPWGGLGLMCGFVAAILLAGYVLLRVRDA